MCSFMWSFLFNSIPQSLYSPFMYFLCVWTDLTPLFLTRSLHVFLPVVVPSQLVSTCFTFVSISRAGCNICSRLWHSAHIFDEGTFINIEWRWPLVILASQDAIEVMCVTDSLSKSALALTLLMWPWWVMIPIEDFTDVILITLMTLLKVI